MENILNEYGGVIVGGALLTLTAFLSPPMKRRKISKEERTISETSLSENVRSSSANAQCDDQNNKSCPSIDCECKESEGVEVDCELSEEKLCLVRQNYESKYKAAAAKSSVVDQLYLSPLLDEPYLSLTEALTSLNIPVLRSDPFSAIINLESFLGPEKTFEAEANLMNELFGLGIIICPGQLVGEKCPGRFRVSCMSLTSDQLSLLSVRLSLLRNKRSKSTPVSSPVSSNVSTTSEFAVSTSISPDESAFVDALVAQCDDNSSSIASSECSPVSEIFSESERDLKVASDEVTVAAEDEAVKTGKKSKKRPRN